MAILQVVSVYFKPIKTVSEIHEHIRYSLNEKLIKFQYNHL